MGRLREICQLETDLKEHEIRKLEAVEEQLPLIAALTDADVFIDCFVDEKAAVVVAQAGPRISGSVYARDVVGKLALMGWEPAVFHARAISMPVCDLKAITQENRAVRQNVAPIFGDGDRVIAVLIREKDVSVALQQEKKYEQLAHSYGNGKPVVLASSGQPVIDMQEVYHRVKNSLQLVASILDLQARRSQDPNVKKILRENWGRVLSIASIHDILTKNAGQMTLINSRILIEQIEKNLQALIPIDRSIRLSVSGDEIELNSDTATSVAMVITELLTNALQHAFEDRDEGTVDVSLCKGTLFHTVTVSDDGSGFALPWTEADGLGLKIVRSTVSEKLKGRLRISSGSGGTKVSFDFANELNNDFVQ